jgi:hypothetical protein
MERRSAEVQVTTAGHRWAYGSKYGPLLASRSGFYTFKLKYRNSPRWDRLRRLVRQ